MVPDLRLAVGRIARPAAVGSRHGGPASTRQCRGRRYRDQGHSRRKQCAREPDSCAGLPSPGKVLPWGMQNRQSPSSAYGVSCRAGAKGAALPLKWVRPKRLVPPLPARSQAGIRRLPVIDGAGPYTIRRVLSSHNAHNFVAKGEIPANDRLFAPQRRHVGEGGCGEPLVRRDSARLSHRSHSRGGVGDVLVGNRPQK